MRHTILVAPIVCLLAFSLEIDGVPIFDLNSITRPVRKIR